MKKTLLFGLVFLFSHNLSPQTIYEEFASEKLLATRKIKIQLPRNYQSNIDKRYPIVLVLDGDYLFEPVAGNVDYYSYWEDMPDAIVVGVIQGENRYADCEYDNMNFLPAENGAKFFEFLGMELIPYIDKKYRTAKFIVGVGHDFTANFLNYYLFKTPSLLNGIINLSPDFAPMMEERLVKRIPELKQKIFYYLATGTQDVKELHDSAESLKAQLQGLESETFSFYYDNFEDANHYSLVGKGIPNALDKIFSLYRPISPEEYSQVLLTMETPISQYLIDKYSTIKDLFGIENKIRLTDFLTCARASEKTQQWESLKEIAELAKRQYPTLMLSDYYLGRYYEETGNPKKALRMFQGAFNKAEFDFITLDLLTDRANKIKADFGY